MNATEMGQLLAFAALYDNRKVGDPDIVAWLEAIGDLPYADEFVYLGGPVQPEAVVVLAELLEPVDGTEPIVGNVVYMPPGMDPDELPASRVRVFAGYSGWGPGQLEAELAEPAWIVAGAEASDVFAADPDELWRRVLHRKGGKFTLIATMPYDPSLN